MGRCPHCGRSFGGSWFGRLLGGILQLVLTLVLLPVLLIGGLWLLHALGGGEWVSKQLSAGLRQVVQSARHAVLDAADPKLAPEASVAQSVEAPALHPRRRRAARRAASAPREVAAAKSSRPHALQEAPPATAGRPQRIEGAASPRLPARGEAPGAEAPEARPPEALLRELLRGQDGARRQLDGMLRQM